MRESLLSLPADPGPVILRFPGPPGAASPRGREGGATEPLAVLSLRETGDMRYAELDGGEAARRAAFFSSLGLDPARVLATELFHTRRVLLRDRAGSRLYGPESPPGDPGARGTDPRGGGTARPGSHDGILLAEGAPEEAACVTVADCMPIWILDRATGIFGVLHSGWKGTGILEVAIRAILEAGGSAPAVSVILGPAIGPCCYDVDEARARGFAAEFGAASACMRDGRHRLDLRAANRAIAERLGVGDLMSVEACTSCDPRLGSFRREGPSSFTRMAALAVRSLPAGFAPAADLPDGGAAE